MDNLVNEFNDFTKRFGAFIVQQQQLLDKKMAEILLAKQDSMTLDERDRQQNEKEADLQRREAALAEALERNRVKTHLLEEQQKRLDNEKLRLKNVLSTDE